MVGAQKIWLSRWLGKPDAKILSANDVGSLKELKEVWEGVGYDTARFLSTMTDRKLQEIFTYATSTGDTYEAAWHQAARNRSDRVLP